MTDPTLLVALASTGIAAFAMATAAALKGWQGWLEVRRMEIDMRRRRPGEASAPVSSRIELADLRERVRRLEAIANGAEL
jgi:hypothetical protein